MNLDEEEQLESDFPALQFLRRFEVSMVHVESILKQVAYKEKAATDTQFFQTALAPTGRNEVGACLQSVCNTRLFEIEYTRIDLKSKKTFLHISIPCNFTSITASVFVTISAFDNANAG